MLERYNMGVKDGKQALADDYANRANELRNNWAIDKGNIENEAQKRINAIKADADYARNTADRLQQTVNEVRSIANRSGIPVTTSTSTGKAINMLADMLIKSNNRANIYAEYADRAFEAGRTCEIQYDKMRNRIIEQKTTH